MIRVLYRIGLLNPFNLWQIIRAIKKNGFNLMAFLIHYEDQGNKNCLTANGTKYSYAFIRQMANNFSAKLINTNGPIYIALPNSKEIIISLVAASTSGRKTIFLDPSLNDNRLKEILKSKDVGVLICEKGRELNYELLHIEITDQITESPISKQRMGDITVLSSGTTGKPKENTRSTSLKNYTAVLKVLINEIKLHEYKGAFIATPIFHGFGLAATITALALGKSIKIESKFKPERIKNEENEAEVLIAVPSMLEKLRKMDSQVFKAFKVVLTGGDRLLPSTEKELVAIEGLMIYNLYGTSETGFCLIASKEDLIRYPGTNGQPIKGIQFKLNESNELMIKNRYSFKEKSTNWVNTKDVFLKNEKGFLFYKGRNDDRIVSGGENIFLSDLKDRISLMMPKLTFELFPIRDDIYGKKIGLVFTNMELSIEEIQKTINAELLSFERPRVYVKREVIPRNALGKINYKELTNA